MGFSAIDYPVLAITLSSSLASTWYVLAGTVVCCGVGYLSSFALGADPRR
jgi:hypothetical protein